MRAGGISPEIGPTTPKSKGKSITQGISTDSKGGGKSGNCFPKGVGKFGKGPKGGGRGYQGECWICVKAGHKTMECYSNVTVDAVEQDFSDTCQDVEVGGIWMVAVSTPLASRRAQLPRLQTVKSGGVPRRCSERQPRTNTKIQIRFDKLAVDGVVVNHVGAEARRLTRKSGMNFPVAKVQKPLASAAKVAAAGTRIVMGPVDGKSFIENVATGEMLELRVDMLHLRF